MCKILWGDEMTDYLLKNLFVMQYSPGERGKKVNGRRLSTFMYVEEGQYRYKSDYVDFLVCAGDTVYVPEGAVYEYTVVSSKTKVIQVEFSFEKRGDERIIKFSEHPRLMKKTANNLRTLFLEMLNNYFTNEYFTVAVVYKLISVFTEHEDNNGIGRIEPALRYIEKNFKDKIYISQLAELCKAQQVQSIGSKFVLYKRNETDPKIELPKSKKK